jgi:hypothetical protein
MRSLHAFHLSNATYWTPNREAAVMKEGHATGKLGRSILFFISNITTFVLFDLFLGYTKGAAGGMFVAFFESILGPFYEMRNMPLRSLLSAPGSSQASSQRSIGQPFR